MCFFNLTWATLLAAWVAKTSTDFTLYKHYDDGALVAGLALSGTCLAALNTTVKCNETAAHLLGEGVDIHYWTSSDAQSLCSADCVDSLNAWESRVNTVCGDETTIQNGIIVKARALPLTFTYNAGLVCTRDATSSWCFVESQSWRGSDYIRYDTSMCFSDGDNNSTVAPQCWDPNFDLDEIDSDMAAIRNLYGKDLLYCKRLLNPWLPVSNFTDYLIGQFDDLQSNCSTTLPYSTSASTLYVEMRQRPQCYRANRNGPVHDHDASLPGQRVQPLESWLICDDLSDTFDPNPYRRHLCVEACCMV